VALYGEDLAYVHHVAFTDFARGAAPGLLEMLATAGVRSGTVVDLGCGSGVWLKALSGAGFTAIGVDGSRALLEIARRHATSATLHHGSFGHLAIPHCDAVTAIGEVLGYDDPTGTRRSMRRVFQRAAKALRPGGLLIFDLFCAASGRPMAYRSWRAGRDWAVLIEVAEDRPRARLKREVTVFRRVGKGYRRSHERHVLRVYSRAEIEAGLRLAGFSVRVSRRYGQFVLPPRRLAFRARKR